MTCVVLMYCGVVSSSKDISDSFTFSHYFRYSNCRALPESTDARLANNIQTNSLVAGKDK